jgi:hypothetical protein
MTRVTRLTALAIRLDGLIRTGEVRDQAAVARLGRITRVRVTQIINVVFLVPDIQEQLLFLPPITGVRAPILLRDLQLIAAVPNWSKRLELWRALYTSHSPK